MKRAILLVLLGVIAQIVGAMAFEDAEKEQELYCAMVAEKTWRDYKLINDQCPGGR